MRSKVGGNYINKQLLAFQISFLEYFKSCIEDFKVEENKMGTVSLKDTLFLSIKEYKLYYNLPILRILSLH